MSEQKFNKIVEDFNPEYFDSNNFSGDEKQFYNINLFEAENIILGNKNVHQHNFYFALVKLFYARFNIDVFYMDETIHKNQTVVCMLENSVNFDLPVVYDHKTIFQKFKEQFSIETLKNSINEEYKLNIKFMTIERPTENTIQLSYSFNSPTLHVMAPLEYICKEISKKYEEITVNNINKSFLQKFDIHKNKENFWNCEEIPVITDKKHIQDITNSLEQNQKKLFVFKQPSKNQYDYFMTYANIEKSSDEFKVEAQIHPFFAMKDYKNAINLIKEKIYIKEIDKMLKLLYNEKSVTVTNKNNHVSISYKAKKDWDLGLQYTMDLLTSMIERKYNTE